MTRNVLDDPKSSEMFCALFYIIFWSKPEVSIFKNGWDMANLINFMFYNIKWPEMHWLTPKLKCFIRNLYATKKQSFINLGREILFLNFVTSLWPYRSSEVKGQGAKWKNCYDFLSKVNCNCVPIWYRFQDIASFYNLLIKLISLITMVWSGPNSIDFQWLTKTRVNYQSKVYVFILHHSEDTDRWKHYIVTVTF